MTNNVIQHPKAVQALGGLRVLHPRELNDELTARLVRKMETLAGEAYLDGRRRGFKEGWINGATIVLALCLLLLIAGVIVRSEPNRVARDPASTLIPQSATGVDMRVSGGTDAAAGAGVASDARADAATTGGGAGVCVAAAVAGAAESASASDIETSFG